MFKAGSGNLQQVKRNIAILRKSLKLSSRTISAKLQQVKRNIAIFGGSAAVVVETVKIWKGGMYINMGMRWGGVGGWVVGSGKNALRMGMGSSL